MGERTSARLFAAALKACGINANFLDPTDKDWPIITDENFGDANPIIEECICRAKNILEPSLSKGIVPILPGFIGKTLHGEITTLGRGGSDTTAFLIAKAIGAKEVILVSDVRGIMLADPKIVPNTKIIEKIDAKALMNLCDQGNKFLHRKALKFIDGSFKVKIVSYESEKLDGEGTIIEGETSRNDNLPESSTVATITLLAKKPSSTLEISAESVKEIKRNKLPILMMLVDDNSVNLYVPDKKAEQIVKILHFSGPLRDKILSIALRRKIVLTKIFLKTENIDNTIRLITESLEKNRRKLLGISTIASNVYILLANKIQI
jgi:aspartate kinase